MKKAKSMVAVLLLSTTLMFTSCIGSFKLTNQLLDWNRHIGHKFVNELVFLVISPAYAVAGTIDMFILNTVEFWSGNNPMDAETTVQTVQGENGEYLVERDNTGYTITNTADQSVVELRFNEETQTWSAIAGGQQTDILTFNEDGNVTMHLPDGTTMQVEPTRTGVIAFQEYLDASMPVFAAR